MAVLFGVALCLFTGCINLMMPTKVSWQVIFCCGMIPLGVAMKTTGTDVFIADQLFTVLKSVPASVTITIIFCVHNAHERLCV
jgi:di/tricarboxylate transporter